MRVICFHLAVLLQQPVVFSDLQFLVVVLFDLHFLVVVLFDLLYLGDSMESDLDILVRIADSLGQARA